MDGERSASENLAKLKKKRIPQNPASPKPRLWKYQGPLLSCSVTLQYSNRRHAVPVFAPRETRADGVADSSLRIAVANSGVPPAGAADLVTVVHRRF